MDAYFAVYCGFPGFELLVSFLEPLNLYLRQSTGGIIFGAVQQCLGRHTLVQRCESIERSLGRWNVERHCMNFQKLAIRIDQHRRRHYHIHNFQVTLSGIIGKLPEVLFRKKFA